MYIYFDENNYIYGYGSEYEEKSIAVEQIPAEVAEFLGCYKYENGNYILDTERKEWLVTNKSLEAEKAELEEWFKEYDRQNMQYSRALRLGKKFDKDINELDNEAEKKAKRINEIKERFESGYKNK